MTGQYRQFHPFHATQYALEISCFTFLNIVSVNVNVSLTQNVLNDLFIVIFFAFFPRKPLFKIAYMPFLREWAAVCNRRCDLNPFLVTKQL